MYKNSASLMQLIGRDKQFVLNEYGKPDFASETEGDLKCLLFTIDDKNFIQEYRIESAGKTGNLNRDKYDTYCKEAFWEKTQLEKIKPFHGT
jgi:hypothetical protein